MAQALSALLVIWAVLPPCAAFWPIIVRVSGDYWWLTDWASVAQSRVSCLMRVGWFLPAFLWFSYALSVRKHFAWFTYVPTSRNIYAKVYPDWTCGAPTPNHGETLQHLWGLNPWPRVLLATLQPTVPSGTPRSVAVGVTVRVSVWRPEQRDNTPPIRSAPAGLPLQNPYYCFHQLLVGCCVFFDQTAAT